MSGANADLFRRYEGEEARARALRDKYDRQAQYLVSLTLRQSTIIGEVERVELESQQRITSIRQQLDRLDREEGTIDLRVRQKKRELAALSSALAVNRIALAHNFELAPNLDSRHLLLSPNEFEEVLGHSTYVDEQGIEHRVDFAMGSEEAAPASPRGSPGRHHAAVLVGTAVKPSSTAAHALLRKRACFLLLDQAKTCVMRDLQMVESDYANGRLCEFEHAAQRSPLQKRLGEIRRAIENLGQISTSSGNELGSSFAPSAEEVLAMRPAAADPVFLEKLQQQRRALADLKKRIGEEEELVGKKREMGEQAWTKAVAARDTAEFAASRLEEPKSTTDHATTLQPRPPAAAAAPRPASSMGGSGLSSSSLPTVPRSAQRPSSASLIRRYGSAAKSVLAAAGDTRGDLYEKIAREAAEGSAVSVAPLAGAGRSVYRFASHNGLEAAALSNMRTFTHQVYK